MQQDSWIAFWQMLAMFFPSNHQMVEGTFSKKGESFDPLDPFGDERSSSLADSSHPAARVHHRAAVLWDTLQKIGVTPFSCTDSTVAPLTTIADVWVLTF